MWIETTRFGDIEIPEEQVIQFPRRLYGLDAASEFCLLPHDPHGRFQWLQAVGVPSLALVVTDPFLFFTDYEVEIADPDAELLQAGAPSDLKIYTTITVAADRGELYTNLLGPLVVNHRTGRGAQLIQDASRYSTRHRIGAARPPAGNRPAGDENSHQPGPVASMTSEARRPVTA